MGRRWAVLWSALSVLLAEVLAVATGRADDPGLVWSVTGVLIAAGH